MKYVVYQRRMAIDALKTKAMLMAMLGNGEGAQKVAEQYFELAVPMSKEVKEVKKVRDEQMLTAMEKMGPLRLRDGKLVATGPVP